jgi:DNA polymerase-2
VRYVEMLTKGQCDELLIYKKRMKKPLESYQKNIPPHIKALKAAINEGKISVPKPGFLVEYVQTVDGPRLLSQSKTIDYSYYVERQLKPIYDMVANFDSASLPLSAQHELF